MWLIIEKAWFQAITAATVWNWSGKTLSPGALLPFLTFVRAIFFRPFRLSLAPTICPWVSEDAMELNPKTTHRGPIKIRGLEDLHGYGLPLSPPSTVDLSSFFSQVSVFRWKFSPGDLRKIQARSMISKKGSPRYQCWVWGPQFLWVLVLGILLIFLKWSATLKTVLA